MDKIKREDSRARKIIRKLKSILTKVRISEQRYRGLFESARDGILILDGEQGTIRDVNPFLIKLLGYSREELLGKKLWEIGAFSDAESCKSAFQELRTTGYIHYEDMSLNTKYGQRIEVECLSNIYRVGRRKIIQCHLRDITDRKLLENQLRIERENVEERIQRRSLELAKSNVELKDKAHHIAELEKLNVEYEKVKDSLEETNHFLQSLVKAIPFAVDIVDEEGNILYMNDKLETVLGRNGVGMKCWDVYKDDATQCEQCPLKKGVEFGRVTTIETAGAFGGKAVLINHTAMSYKGRKAILEIFQDITERKQMEEKLRELTINDELTKLNNRRGFFALAEHQLKIANRQKLQMAVLFIDLDNMKWINDTIGHGEGDKALNDVAGILKKTCRESDIIARYGGDEFTVLALDADRKDSGAIVKRLNDNLYEHNIRTSRKYKLSVSVGAAECDASRSPCSINELLEKADRLMYEHKSEKREWKK